MTPTSPSPITEEQSHLPKNGDIPIQDEKFDVSDISTPSRMVSSVYGLETTSDVGRFYSEEPKRISPASSQSWTPPTLRRQKQKLSMGMFFKQIGGVAPYLQSLRSTLTSRNRTPMLKVNSDFYISFKR